MESGLRLFLLVSVLALFAWSASASFSPSSTDVGGEPRRWVVNLDLPPEKRWPWEAMMPYYGQGLKQGVDMIASSSLRTTSPSSWAWPRTWPAWATLASTAARLRPGPRSPVSGWAKPFSSTSLRSRGRLHLNRCSGHRRYHLSRPYVTPPPPLFLRHFAFSLAFYFTIRFRSYPSLEGNLDFNLASLLRNLTIEVDFQSRGQTVFTGSYLTLLIT